MSYHIKACSETSKCFDCCSVNLLLSHAGDCCWLRMKGRNTASKKKLYDRVLIVFVEEEQPSGQAGSTGKRKRRDSLSEGPSLYLGIQ